MSTNIRKLPYLQTFIYAKEDLKDFKDNLKKLESLQEKSGDKFTPEEKRLLQTGKQILQKRSDEFAKSSIGIRMQQYQNILTYHKSFVITESIRAKREAAKRGQTANKRKVDLLSSYSQLALPEKKALAHALYKEIPKLEKELTKDKEEAIQFQRELISFTKIVKKIETKY